MAASLSRRDMKFHGDLSLIRHHYRWTNADDTGVIRADILEGGIFGQGFVTIGKGS